MLKNKRSMRQMFHKGLHFVLAANAFKRKKPNQTLCLPETVLEEDSTHLNLQPAKSRESSLVALYEYSPQDDRTSECSSVYSVSSDDFDPSARDNSLSRAFARKYMELIGDTWSFKGYTYGADERRTSDRSSLKAEEQDIMQRPGLRRDASYGYFSEKSAIEEDARRDSAYESYGSQRYHTGEDKCQSARSTASSVASSPSVSSCNTYRCPSPYEQIDALYTSYGSSNIPLEDEVEEDIDPSSDGIYYARQVTFSPARSILHDPKIVYHNGSSSCQSERRQHPDTTLGHKRWQDRTARPHINELERTNSISSTICTNRVQNPFTHHEPKPGHGSIHSTGSETKQSDFIRARAWSRSLHSLSLTSAPVQQQSRHQFHSHLDPSFHRRSSLPSLFDSRSDKSVFEFEDDSDDDEAVEKNVKRDIRDGKKWCGKRLRYY